MHKLHERALNNLVRRQQTPGKDIGSFCWVSRCIITMPSKSKQKRMAKKAEKAGKGKKPVKKVVEQEVSPRTCTGELASRQLSRDIKFINFSMSFYGEVYIEVWSCSRHPRAPNWKTFSHRNQPSLALFPCFCHTNLMFNITCSLDGRIPLWNLTTAVATVSLAATVPASPPSSGPLQNVTWLSLSISTHTFCKKSAHPQTRLHQRCKTD